MDLGVAMWLRLVLIGLPLAEIALFVQVGRVIGAGAVVLLVLLAGIAGLLLLRRGGLRLAHETREAMRAGHDPGPELTNGALLLLAALLLIVPGFLSDAAALVLLVPWTRRQIHARLRRRIQAGPGATRHSGHTHEPGVIEGDYVEIRPRDPTRPPSGWTGH